MFMERLKDPNMRSAKPLEPHKLEHAIKNIEMVEINTPRERSKYPTYKTSHQNETPRRDKGRPC